MNKTLERAIRNTICAQGNVISGVQFSGYIRAHDETECNGFTRAPGHLRAFDLDIYRKHYPHAYRLASGRTDRTVLYAWRRAGVHYGATLATPEGVILSRVVLRGPGFAASVARLEQAAGLRADGDGMNKTLERAIRNTICAQVGTRT